MEFSEKDSSVFYDLVLHADWGIALSRGESAVIGWCNDYFAELHGYGNREELFGQPVSILFPDSMRDEIPFIIRTANEKGHFSSETMQVRKDGTVFPALLSVSVILNTDGTIKHRIASIQDISEIVNIRERHEEAQEVAHIGHWTLDLNTDKLTWSKEVYRIFGIEPEQFGASYEAFLKAVHPDDRDRVNDAYAESVKLKSDYRVIHRINRPDGKERIVEERCVHTLDSSGNVIRSLGTVHDITEVEQYRMHLEDKVRKETEKRIRQEELLSRQIRMNQMAELISNLAHHWRQPLNTIGLAIQGLPGLYEEGGLTKEYLEKFSSENMEAIVRLSSMIDYFYDLSDRNRSSDSSFSPSEAVTDTIRMLEPVSGGNRFRFTFKENRSCFIKGDKRDFMQCLYSVLSNALDAFTEKRITDGEIQISLQISDTGWLQIEISNNAGEIPESILGRLFDPYFTTKKLHRHRGLGLYQAKLSAEENLHGTIEAQNRNGWAVFRIMLPCFSQGVPAVSS